MRGGESMRSIITDLRNAYSMEVSIGVAEAINPVSSLEAPVAIMVLEGYAQELRERFPEADREVEELKQHSNSFAICSPAAVRPGK